MHAHRRPELRPAVRDRDRARRDRRPLGGAVVRDLLLGPLRFGDLADGLPGIGTNTLTARLKHLEAAGVVRAPAAAAAGPRDGLRADRLRPRARADPARARALGDEEHGAAARGGGRRARAGSSPRCSRSTTRRRRVARPTTWELRLSDGVFTVRREGTSLTVARARPSGPTSWSRRRMRTCMRC